jgi:hypothetical protein
MIAKIKAYEAGFGQNWQSQIVFAADTNDPAAGRFADANAELAALIDAKHAADVVDLNATAITPARNKLMAYFQSGAGIIHYNRPRRRGQLERQGTAEGGGRRGHEQLQPAAGRGGAELLVGRYEAPGVNSLGELLLRKNGGGAVAAWDLPACRARSGQGTGRGVLSRRAAGGRRHAGSGGLQARRGLRRFVPAGHLGVYNLLGDPALRIVNNAGGGRNAATSPNGAGNGLRGELTNAAVHGATAENFADYALAEKTGPAELPESASPCRTAEIAARAESESGVVLRWKRRVRRADIQYVLSFSENLEQWELDPADLQTLAVAPIRTA